MKNAKWGGRSALPLTGFALHVFHFSFAFLLIAVFLLPGCSDSSSSAPQPLVLYTSVDEPYVRPILAEFESRTGIRVIVQTDTEATKSAGLAARLEAERDKPRADVWWGNEVFHTIRLADAGVLAAYESPAAKDVPAKFKDAQHRWAGNGLRARVIVEAVTPGADEVELYGFPTSLQQLLEPRYKGKVGIARPTAGTTGGHVAALYVLWGRDRFVDYFTKLRANDVKLLGGNGPVAEAVGRGELLIGLTDNDDANAVQRNNGRLVPSVPDPHTIGTLAIPTTVALVAGARDPGSAKKLVDYLLSPEVERKLIEAEFAGWSVRAPGDFRAMEVDYHAAAQALPEAVKTAMTILEGRQ